MTQAFSILSIENKIFHIRGKKVMLDKDLAILYGVRPIALKQRVKRNIKRFPEDFMFQLSKSERNELAAICDRVRALTHSSTLTYIFTEQEVGKRERKRYLSIPA